MIALQQALKEITAAFRAGGIDTPELDARLLAQAAANKTREELALHKDIFLTESQATALREMARQRLLRKPVSRILGRRAFWKSDFKVTEDTLDPRADSETLIEAALNICSVPPDRILDLGTGTGCLLLSLLGEWPKAQGTGLDISSGAVGVAAENARHLGLAGRAEFMAVDWQEYQSEGLFDLVISNPPYIAETEKGTLAPEVIDHDPEQALFAGVDGLACYRSIVKLLPRVLEEKGHVILEIGHKQGSAVEAVLEGVNFRIVGRYRDLAGLDRAIVAKKP